jgi:hypothetical protein
MSRVLELQDSRVDYLEWSNGVANLHFSVVYVRASGRHSGSACAEEAELHMRAATLAGPCPPLPNRVAEGFLEVGGIRHELVPLPFKRRAPASLHLQFVDGTELVLTGCAPALVLVGTPIRLEDSD